MNLNTHATNISQATGKDRGNCYKALKTLLDKINQDEIESLTYNAEFSEVTLNGVPFFQDARKHWKRADVHQPIPVTKTVEKRPLIATQQNEVDQSIALAASMMSFITEDTKPIEKNDPYYIGERKHVAQGEDGTKYYTGGIRVENTPDSCTSEPTIIDSSKCVLTADKLKQQLIYLYVSNGISERDAEINANAQINAFSIMHDPELTGTYEKVSDDSFLFNGKETVVFNEDEVEFQKQ
ncbi:hypothetical protein [Aeromonas hydrophila]|uniref:hypothetical protein n=1 Tax=Aeromonas hydrophila TaxID=644 RepID=UPI000C320DC9|nr:hypothetical protein [Aeromonas hydrophila]PKD25073.1 hypothetical protein AO056_01555 [Aeromonas hydrophila]